MEEKNALKALQELKWYKILSALALIAAGVFLIVWPDNALRYICYLVGSCIIFYGLYNIVLFIIARDKTLSFQLYFGIVVVLLGLMVMFLAGKILEFVQFGIAIVIIANSLLKIRRAILMKQVGMKDWGVSLGLSLLTAALGVLFLVKQGLFKDMLFLVLGIVVIFQGVSDLINVLRLGFTGRKLRKHLQAGKNSEIVVDAADQREK